MDGGLFILSLLLTGLAIFLFLRLFPIWPVREWGCDAYYFLLCREAFRKIPRIPIRLNGLFLCDHEEEWYPPGFVVLISMLPDHIMKRYHWAVSNAIDASLVLLVVWLVQDIVGFWPAVGILVAYGLSAGNLAEFAGLTSRSLTSLLFNILLIFSFIGVAGGDRLFIVYAGGVVATIVFTHKLTTQLMWVLFPILATVYGDPVWLIPLIIGYCLALVLAPRMTWKILRAHFDILRFWRQYWPDLGKHQIKASPLYKDGHEQIDGWFKSGSHLRDLLRQVKLMVLTSPWVLPLSPSLVYIEQLGEPQRFALICALIIYCWAGATTLLYPLRFLGEGVKYLKFSELPMLFVVVSAMVNGGALGLATAVLAVPTVLIVLHCYVSTFRAYRCQKAYPARQNTRELKKVFDFIRSTDIGQLLVLPLHLADRTAYETRKPVMWGAHGYGFANLEDFFPVLRRPLSEFILEWNLTHALIDTSDIDMDRIGLDGCRVIFREGPYVVCDLEAQHGTLDMRPNKLENARLTQAADMVKT